ncbi:MAG: hypothetical protein IH860_01295 [Chloroflexi bacterium]|nr:hypothetical protein [Chloroflexota bacterium]
MELIVAAGHRTVRKVFVGLLLIFLLLSLLALSCSQSKEDRYLREYLIQMKGWTDRFEALNVDFRFHPLPESYAGDLWDQANEVEPPLNLRDQHEAYVRAQITHLLARNHLLRLDASEVARFRAQGIPPLDVCSGSTNYSDEYNEACSIEFQASRVASSLRDDWNRNYFDGLKP